MTDTDGNIGNEISVNVEQVSGLLFDISAQTDFWTTGQGAVVAGDLKDKVVEINSLDDAVKLGITPYTGGVSAAGVSQDLLSGIPYYHIKHFFQINDGSGRLFVAFADCTDNWDALIDMQKASGGIISQFGVWTEKKIWKYMDSSAIQYSISLVNELNSVAESMANDYHAPACIILSGNSSKVETANGDDPKVVFSKIADAKVDARYVSVILGQAFDQEVGKMQASLASTTPVGVVGVVLGKLASSNVGHSVAWVQQGNISGCIPSIEMGFGDSTIENGKLKNTTVYSSLNKFQRDTLDDKGYMFLRTYEGEEGKVYLSKDQTCSNGDYCTIARNRAINKSRRLVRKALLPYVNSPVKIDPATGSLSAAQITIYKNLVSDALLYMDTHSEISSVGAITIPANQNILKTKTLILKYSLVPLGCAENIEVTEGLAITNK